MAQLRAMFDALLDEKLKRYEIKRRPPEDITEKRRAAARAMLEKRAQRAIAEQMLPPKKLNGHAHLRANAEQKCIGTGELICVVNGLRGPVEVRQSYVLEMMQAYPAVMVAEEIDRARIWMDDNPTKRKAHVRRFLSGWIRRKQG